ncbi:MAG: type III pantothenate kinase [Burkholderiaceae bacterium]
MTRPQPALLLDLGNTRLKWHLVMGSHIQAQGQGLARSVEGLSGTPGVLDTLDHELADLRLRADPPPRLRVLGGAVGAPAVKGWLTDWLEQHHQLSVTWLRSAPNIELNLPQAVVSLRQPYAEPERLGVDRWLAALGFLGLLARRQWAEILQPADGTGRSRVALVSAGTATVVDGLVVDQQGSVIKGEMSGGFIYPGFETMRSSLAQQTADLAGYVAAARDESINADSFRDSIAAIGAGISSAQVGAIDWLGPLDCILAHGGHAKDWLAAYSMRPVAGDPSTRSPRLRVRALEAPDLVLTGLSLLAEFS